VRGAPAPNADARRACPTGQLRVSTWTTLSRRRVALASGTLLRPCGRERGVFVKRLSIKEIARQMGRDRNTVRKALSLERPRCARRSTPPRVGAALGPRPEMVAHCCDGCVCCAAGRRETTPLARSAPLGCLETGRLADRERIRELGPRGAPRREARRRSAGAQARRELRMYPRLNIGPGAGATARLNTRKGLRR
jgi:hypothetical protein